MLEGLIKINNRLQYCSKFPDGTVIYYCILTIEQYRTIDGFRKVFNLEDNAFYEEVFNLCVSDSFKNLGGRVRAGIPISIGQFIWHQSYNFESVEQEIESARIKYNNKDIYEQMKTTIHHAFGTYKVSELEALTRIELIELFVRAETQLELKSEGKYKPVNTKKLRKKDNEKIDFSKENREIMKEFGNNPNGAGDPWSRNGHAHELLMARERAQRQGLARKERIKNSG